MKFSHHQFAGKLRYFGYSLVVAWLLVLFSHSTHAETLSQSDNDVACHFCQNTLDNNPDVNLEPAVTQRVIHHKQRLEKPLSAKSVKFYWPNLRAPPQ